MRKKIIKYALSILVIVFIAYHSVYFEKLDKVKLASSSKGFKASTHAQDFYNNKLLPHLGSAIKLGELISLLKTEPRNAFGKYSHALGLGNVRYFLVQGEGVISSVGEDAVALSLKNNQENTNITVTTEFVYGNAIRDASGLINLNDFSNTADLNSLSEEINKIVRRDVVSPFKSKAKPGSVVKFTGAIELNQAHLNIDDIEVLPIQLTILN
jgi:predicted lipoprotein